MTNLDWEHERGRLWRQQLSGLEAMLAPVNNRLIDALKLSKAHHIADIGSGGGATSIALLNAAPPGSRVTGFDISADLIDAAQSKYAAHADRLTFVQTDAQRHTGTDRQFDRLTSRFGIMFFDDPATAFANLARWLTPDGEFAFAVWAPPKANPWMSEIRRVVEQFIDLPEPDMGGPGPFRYQDGDAFTHLLSQSGFRNVVFETWSGLLPIGGGLNAQSAADFALAAFSLGQRLIAESPMDLNAAKASLSARFAADEMDGIVRMPAAVHIVTGRR